jgi:ubiquinol-cytochrome c reductase cytochrome b subunit
MHLNGAAFLFILMYLHIARGLFMKSYILKRSAVWYTGIIILVLTMGTAFIGYVLI